MTKDEWQAARNPKSMLKFLWKKASGRKLRLFSVSCCRRVWELITFESGRAAVEIAERHADRVVEDDEWRNGFVAAIREASQWVNNCGIADNAIGYATGAAAYVLADGSTIESEAASAGASVVLDMIQIIHSRANWRYPARIVALETSFAAGTAVVAYLSDQESPEETGDYRPEERQVLSFGSAYADRHGLNRADRGSLDSNVVFDKVRRAEQVAQCNLLRDIFGNPFRPVTLHPSWLTSDVHTLATGIYADRAFDRMPILADALQDAGCDNDDILNHCRGDELHVRGCWVVDLLLGKS